MALWHALWRYHMRPHMAAIAIRGPFGSSTWKYIPLLARPSASRKMSFFPLRNLLVSSYLPDPTKRATDLYMWASPYIKSRKRICIYCREKTQKNWRWKMKMTGTCAKWPPVHLCTGGALFCDATSITPRAFLTRYDHFSENLALQLDRLPGIGIMIIIFGRFGFGRMMILQL